MDPMKTGMLVRVACLGLASAAALSGCSETVEASAAPTATPQAAVQPGKTDEESTAAVNGALKPLPPVSPRAIADVTGDVSPLAGTWLGSSEGDQNFPTPFGVTITVNADSSVTGTLDGLADAEYGIALRRIALDHGSVSLQTQRSSFVGTLSADGSEITGVNKQLGIVNNLFLKAFGQPTAVRFVMHRADLASFPLRPQSHSYTVDGHSVHYEEVAGSSAARILFIHGSPGEWGDFGGYLSNAALQQRATMIAVDRPGWGESEPGKLVTDIREQARLLEPLLRETPGNGDSTSTPAGQANHHVPMIVVGWSNGGPIAAEMALDYPDEMEDAVLIAPAIAPAYGGAQWYNRAATFWPVGKLVSWLTGPGLMWSNREMMPLEAQLKTMEPRWKTLKVPVTVIQGSDDDLVDPQTADFAEQVLPPGNHVVRVPGAGHGVVFTKTALDTLNQVLDRAIADAKHG